VNPTKNPVAQSVTQAPKVHAMNKNGVIEWAPFTLVEGIDEAKLLQASQALQADFLSQQKGFLRRELLKGKDNAWVDLIYWESPEAAEQVRTPRTVLSATPISR
jgi:hypothetical protein